MNNLKDTRWKQRFENYENAFKLLKQAVDVKNPNVIERAGLIQFFEMSFELAWNLLKDYLGSTSHEVKSSTEAIKTAFQQGIIKNGHDWMDALTDRNLTVHTYDEETADMIEKKVKQTYYPLLAQLYRSFKIRL